MSFGSGGMWLPNQPKRPCICKRRNRPGTNSKKHLTIHRAIFFKRNAGLGEKKENRFGYRKAYNDIQRNTVQERWKEVTMEENSLK